MAEPTNAEIEHAARVLVQSCGGSMGVVPGWLRAFVDACDDRDRARAQRDEAIQTAGQLRDQVAVGHRVQLAVAGQWLGHAAENLGDAPAAAYLQALAEWLTGNAQGDEPEAPGG